MRGDYAAVYDEHRRRMALEREDRLFAVSYRAVCWSDVDLAADVGPGWRRLVIDFHQQLLGVDPGASLFQVSERHGLLHLRASFSRLQRNTGRLLVARFVARSSHTCEVCGDRGRAREERPLLRTLCDACWNADRALAGERGERYANLTLAQLLSGDPRHPDPEEIVAYLDGGHD